MAILIQGALASAFALSNTYDKLLGYAVFADWIFFALAGVALIVFRFKLPGGVRTQRTPFYPVTPILFSLVGVGIVLNTFVADIRNALIGSAVIALGVPVFFLWRRRTRSQLSPRESGPSTSLLSSAAQDLGQNASSERPADRRAQPK